MKENVFFLVGTSVKSISIYKNLNAISCSEESDKKTSAITHCGASYLNCSLTFRKLNTNLPCSFVHVFTVNTLVMRS